MKTILVDCDDVLLEWKQGFRQFLAVHHKIETAAAGPDDWCMGNWLGCSPERAIELVQEFNASRYFGELVPTFGSMTALNDLYARGWHVAVVTSCGCDPVSVVRRTRNLTLVFRHLIDDIHCVPLGEPKGPVLAAYPEGCFWIEDNYQNAVSGLAHGHKPFVIRKSHNLKHEGESLDGIVWVNSWLDIVRQIPRADS